MRQVGLEAVYHISVVGRIERPLTKPGEFTKVTRFLNLEDSLFIAKGAGRAVFQHPCRNDMLVKVVRPDRLTGLKPTKNTLFRRIFRPISPQHVRFGPYREWFREHEEYIAVLNRLRALPEFVANYHGFADTSLGLGMVVERISRPDGRIAPTLEEAVAANGDGPALQPLVAEMFAQVEQGRAVLKDVVPRNIVLGISPDRTRLRLVVVDGLSDATVVRVKTWSAVAYRRWLLRRRQRIMDFVAHHRAPFDV